MDRRKYSLFAAATAGGPVRMTVASFGAWRDAARALLRAGVAPNCVEWCAGEEGGGAVGGGAAREGLSGALNGPQRASTGADGYPARIDRERAPEACLRHGSARSVPRALLTLLACAACCRVDDRWSVLYRVLWRRQHGDDSACSPDDADGARLHAMVAIVRVELERARAAIRFFERPAGMGAPRFIGWCEPAHDILTLLAKHFRKRLARVTWMIASPDASLLWDGAVLRHTGAPLHRVRGRDRDAPWLAYYRHAARVSTLRRPRVPASGHAHGIADRTAQVTAIEQAHAFARGPVQAATHGPSGSVPDGLEHCRRCGLWEHATQAVGGVGAAPAGIMLVGEQPGDREDIDGQPFVGPAGMLLDRALAEAGLDRRKVYITNAVKHFKWTPRGKRRMHKTPTQSEVAACRYWLDAELAKVKPRVVVALGSTALKAVLDDAHATLKELMGSAVGHGGRWVVATYHPAYVLRVPDPAGRQQAFAALVDALRRAQVLVSAHPQSP